MNVIEFLCLLCYVTPKWKWKTFHLINRFWKGQIFWASYIALAHAFCSQLHAGSYQSSVDRIIWTWQSGFILCKLSALNYITVIHMLTAPYHISVKGNLSFGWMKQIFSSTEIYAV
jgi:hypothetical protein